jgi:hypothetical protein
MEPQLEILNYSSPPRRSVRSLVVFTISMIICVYGAIVCAISTYGHYYHYISYRSDGWKLHWAPANIWHLPATYGFVVFSLTTVGLLIRRFRTPQNGSAG